MGMWITIFGVTYECEFVRRSYIGNAPNTFLYLYIHEYVYNIICNISNNMKSHFLFQANWKKKKYLLDLVYRTNTKKYICIYKSFAIRQMAHINEPQSTKMFKYIQFDCRRIFFNEFNVKNEIND